MFYACRFTAARVGHSATLPQNPGKGALGVGNEERSSVPAGFTGRSRHHRGVNVSTASYSHLTFLRGCGTFVRRLWNYASRLFPITGVL